jgi:trigger factor
VRFEGGTAENAQLELGASSFIPGFAEPLEGMKVGETRTIDVTFPADYQAAELAGRAAQFEITAKALSKPVEAAQDDTLATKIGFESFAKLEEAVRAQMQAEFDQLSRLRLKRELLDILAERAQFESPPSMLDIEFSAIWQRVQADRAQGQQDEDDVGKDEETLKAEYRAIADRRVRLGLLLSEIGRVNDVQVTPAELSAALRQEASRYPGQEAQVVDFFRKNQGAIEQLRGPIFEDKVVDHILRVARVEEKLVAPEDLTMPDAVLPAVAAAAIPLADSEDAQAASETEAAATGGMQDDAAPAHEEAADASGEAA